MQALFQHEILVPLEYQVNVRKSVLFSLFLQKQRVRDVRPRLSNARKERHDSSLSAFKTKGRTVCALSGRILYASLQEICALVALQQLNEILGGGVGLAKEVSQA